MASIELCCCADGSSGKYAAAECNSVQAERPSSSPSGGQARPEDEDALDASEAAVAAPKVPTDKELFDGAESGEPPFVVGVTLAPFIAAAKASFELQARHGFPSGPSTTCGCLLDERTFSAVRPLLFSSSASRPDRPSVSMERYDVGATPHSATPSGRSIRFGSQLSNSSSFAWSLYIVASQR